MKAISHLTLGAIFAIVATSVFAGRSANNGGGVWVCWKDETQKEIVWAQLADLYETVHQWNKTLISTDEADYRSIVEDIQIKLGRVAPHLSSVLRPHIEKIYRIMDVRDDRELGLVKDAFYLVKPAKRECAGYIKENEPHQLANYTDDGLLSIDGFIFTSEKFVPLSRAATIMHEAIYAYLRGTYGAKTSDVTRKAVAYIFSELTDSELAKELATILGEQEIGDPNIRASLATVNAINLSCLLGEKGIVSALYRKAFPYVQVPERAIDTNAIEGGYLSGHRWLLTSAPNGNPRAVGHEALFELVAASQPKRKTLDFYARNGSGHSISSASPMPHLTFAAADYVFDPQGQLKEQETIVRALYVADKNAPDVMNFRRSGGGPTSINLSTANHKACLIKKLEELKSTLPK